MRALLLLAATAPAFAAAQVPLQRSYEDLAALDARIAVAVESGGFAQPGSVAPLDRRLRLLKCPNQPEIVPGATSVGVACRALGWQVRLPFGASTVAAARAWQPGVKRGDPVQIEWQGNGFSALTPGTALHDAAIGAQVRTKTASGAMVAGVSGEGGIVRVTP